MKHSNKEDCAEQSKNVCSAQSLLSESEDKILLGHGQYYFRLSFVFDF